MVKRIKGIGWSTDQSKNFKYDLLNSHKPFIRKKTKEHK